MPLKFSLTDNVTGTSTMIDEPIGMDKVALHLRRDENYHGFLDAIDDSLGSFQFYGEAYVKLKGAYLAYGVDADMRLVIEFSCTDSDNYIPLYKGKFSFDQYKEIRGTSGCYIECAIQNGYDLQTFRSRMNQKVCLDSLNSFDDPDVSLPAYSQLGKKVKLNSKMVRFLDYATIDTTGEGSTSYHAAKRYSDGSIQYSGTDVVFTNPLLPAFVSPADGSTNTENNEFLLNSGGRLWCVVPFTNIRSSEFGEFPGCVGDVYNSDISALSDLNEVFHYTPEIPFLKNDIQIDINISGALFMAYQDDTNCGVSVSVAMYKGLTWSDALANNTLAYTKGARACKLDYSPLTLTAKDGVTTGTTLPLYNTLSAGVVDYCTFNYQYNETIQFYPGEKLYFLFKFDKTPDVHLHLAFYSQNYTYRNTYYYNATTHTTDWTIPQELDVYVDSSYPLSYFKLTFDSQYKITNAPAYLVNEALSRSVELITNDALRVYSTYFGRAGTHPSLPYAPTETGPSALTSLTNGLLLRGSSPLQTWFMGTGRFHLNSQTSDYTLSSLDQPTDGSGALLAINSPTDVIVTIPTDSAFNFNIGATILIEQTGPGSITVQSTTGVSLSVPGSNYSTSGPNSLVLLTKVAADSWLLSNSAPMFASFQEMIEALNSVYAIGLGLEKDNNRTGDHDFVRVEPIRYFYDDTRVVMTCDNVDSIETDTSAGDAISVFKTGYTKWEAEEANGLDEFLTKREYRTTLSSLRKSLDKQCKYLASGYAIEVTRRKLGTSTTDWRYDNDTFIICLSENDASTDTQDIHPDFMSEKGGMIRSSTLSPTAINPTGILSPETVYNYRISPARNALRWLPYIVNSYADWANGKLVFMSGDGNYTAQGLLANDPIEAYPINESDTLSLDKLADSSIRPIYRNEVVKFKYPMSYEQWKYINTDNNKYGKVLYSVNGGNYEEGYIKELKYDLYGGIAEFTLKPKIV